jgi:hypothetical protein
MEKNMNIVKLQKKDGKLIYVDPKEKLKYEIFIDNLAEDEVVEMYMEVSTSDGTASQVAKVHTCIRELAKESGYTFEEMKVVVKEKAGLIIDKGTTQTIKSFADCSKDELSQAIQACIEIGEFYNVNLA